MVVRRLEMVGGAVKASWYERGEGWRKVDAEVIEEAHITIYINGFELATIMATPRDQVALALGFMMNEGMLRGMDEVVDIRLTEHGCCVDIWLSHAFIRPTRAIITSGCGGGITFDDLTTKLPPLEDGPQLDPDDLVGLLNQLHFPGSLYARARGSHVAGLAQGSRLLALAEDVGRHNTIDKLTGICVQQGIETAGRILLATGRVSSEMMRKAGRMGCPIVASRNSPTSMSVEMAEALNITLVGYVSRQRMRVYTHPERLGIGQPVAVGIIRSMQPNHVD
jgi:FdhD protein